MIINGIDYEKRIAELTAGGVAWDGTDDTVFGVPFVFCNQHLRAHGTGWCTVSNVEKVTLRATTHGEADDEAAAMRATAIAKIAPVGQWLPKEEMTGRGTT